MCDYNQNNIEICSIQQVRADRELLYIESWHLKHVLTDMLTELAWVTILNLLLCTDHISQCADHNIMMCHMKAVCFDFKAVS